MTQALKAKKRTPALPSEYLEGFAKRADGKVWRYSTKGNHPRCVSPTNVGYTPDTWLGQDVEGAAENAMLEDCLCEPQIWGPSALVTPAEKLTCPVMRQVLGRYLGLMLVWQPQPSDEGQPVVELLLRELLFQDFEGSSIMEAYIESHPEILAGVNLVLDEIGEKMAEHRSTRPVYGGRTVRMLLAATYFADKLSEMRWRLIHAPADAFFVTGDRPIIFGHWDASRCFVRGGLNRPSAVIQVALSGQLALEADRRGSDDVEQVEADAAMVETINRRTIGAARHWVYSAEPDEAIQRLVEEVGSSP